MTAAGGVIVTVPATSANLGPGFDSFGLALGLYDEVRALTTPAGLRVDVSGEAAGDVPRDATHLVVRAMLATFQRLGVEAPGLALTCRNHVPHGRGLGSSAAAIVAGVLAARALVPDADLDDTGALELAAELEGHPDNVAACLLGGLTVAWHDGPTAHAVRLLPAPEVAAVLFVPGDALPTETARGLLPATVPHADAAHSAGRAALLVEAITHRPDLLLAATEDRLHQDYRASAMPATAALVAELRTAGVPAVVSGAGPSALALTPDGSVAQQALEQVIAGSPTVAGWAVLRLPLDARGAVVSTVTV